MTPAFLHPHCDHCDGPVERFVVERFRETGSYVIFVSCHDKHKRLVLTEDDMVGYEAGPLVKIRMPK